MRDLNKCPECSDLLVIGASGTLGCVNDDCNTEVVGMIYEKPITFEEQGQLLPKHVVSNCDACGVSIEKKGLCDVCLCRGREAYES